AISLTHGCHCEAGAAGRSNLVTLTRRFPGPRECVGGQRSTLASEASGSALPARHSTLGPEASGNALLALRDCFVALRAPRNDSRGFSLAVTAVGDPQRSAACRTMPSVERPRLPNPACHCEAGAAGRSNLVTLSRRVPEALGRALPARHSTLGP